MRQTSISVSLLPSGAPSSKRNLYIFPHIVLLGVIALGCNHGGISFPHDTFDLGTKRVGDVLDFAVDFSNTSNEALKIEGIKTSCSCVRARCTNALISPGSNGKVLVSIDTKGQSGKQTYRVFVSSGAKARKVKTIAITYNLKRGLFVDSSIAFLSPIDEVSASKELMIRTDSGKRVGLRSVSCDNPLVGVSVPDGESVDPILGLRGKVEISRPPGGGTVNAQIMVSAEDVNMETVFVPVHVVFRRPIECRPEQINWGYIKPGESSQRQLTVTAYSEGDIQTVQLEVPPFIAIEAITKTNHDRVYTLKIAPPHSTSGMLKSVLILRIPDGNSVEIPAYACVTP